MMNSFSDETDGCCRCPVEANRCTEDQCACIADGKLCDSTCSSCSTPPNVQKLSSISEVHHSAKIVRCSCNVQAAELAKANAQTAQKKIKDKLNEILQLCNASSCDCFKFYEQCNDECLCQGVCSNVSSKFVAIPKERPLIGCKCGTGKKSCHKFEKCPCKKLFQHCSPACKCKCDCANGTYDADLSKAVKLCFISPDQDISALVVRMKSENFNFQAEFTNEKHPTTQHVEEIFYDHFVDVMSHYVMHARRVIVYLSKSPCFHQDCEPKCEVLDECRDNKACAKILAVMYQQLKRRCAPDVNVEMTVKFLFPNVKRGDLFTKQAILTMMEAGIVVEPIGVKEWGELLRDKQVGGSHHTENDGPSTFAQWMDTWRSCGMDAYVRQTQSYINDGRRTLGLKDCYWSSGTHDLLKLAVQSTIETQMRFEEIARRLTVNAGDSKPTSRDATLVESTDRRNSEKKKPKKKYMARSNTGPMANVKNGSFSTSKSETDDLANLQRSSTVRSSSTNNLSVDYGASVTTDARVERLLMTLSARNITEEERDEIKCELAIAVEDIRGHLQRFMDLLEQRITTTAL